MRDLLNGRLEVVTQWRGVRFEERESLAAILKLVLRRHPKFYILPQVVIRALIGNGRHKTGNWARFWWRGLYTIYQGIWLELDWRLHHLIELLLMVEAWRLRREDPVE